MRIARPANPVAVEHIARIDRIVYENEESNFVIVALQDGLTAMGSGCSDDFSPGLTYRFLGKWVEDAKRGYQFRFTTHVVHGVHGRAGVVKYLCELCDGIGPKAAEKLWVQFGSDAVEKVRTAPAEVAKITGIHPEVISAAAETLEENKRFEATKIDLHTLFSGRGFGSKTIAKCIKKFGARAPEVIRRNPYRLLGLPSAGFKRCDKLYLDLGHRSDSLKRQAICTADLIERSRDGHTWHDAEDVATRLRELIPTADPFRAFRLGIRARLIDKYLDPVSNRMHITSWNNSLGERMIAQHIARLSSAPTMWPTESVSASQVEGDGKPSDHQIEKLRAATVGPVGLFCGSPGTGKTHTLAYLLKEVVAEHGRSAVSVIAPTGKAAVRASQALRAAGVDLPATTVHSALMACGAIGIPDEDELSDEIDDYDGSGGYIESKFIVVDETSMINTSLMALLLSAISTGTNVLFVGDPHQLPPVGHGSPLRDLIAAGLPYGELTQVRRNAGQIVHACLRIKCGEEFESNEVFDLTAKPPRNLRVVNAKDEADQIETLEIVLRAVKQFHPIWGTQVIIARNKGGLITRKELNEKLQAILNPDGARAGKNPFRVGDKIICLKNSRQQVVTLRTGGSEFNPLHYDQLQHQPNAWDKPEPKQVYVANGEIGRVIAVSEKLMIARFSESDDIVKIPVGGSTSREESSESESDDSGRGCNFDLAYAVTCHKLQGSSAPFVIVVADQAAGGIATREWWYTAISRASQMCMIIGQQSVVRKQCLRVSTSRRKTFLAEAVAKSISDQEATDARS